MTLTSRHVESVAGTFVQTRTSSSFTPAAGARLYVWAGAIGFDEPYDWAITDTEGLTWEELFAPADLEDLGDTSFDGSLRMWYADVGGSPSSMTVTVDCYDGSATTSSYGWTVIEDPEGREIARSDFLAYAAASNSDTTINSIALDLGATPAGEQLFLYTRGTNSDGTDTYDSNPTDFDDLGEDLTGYITIGTLVSPDGTDGTVEWGGSGPGQSRLSGGAFIEFAAVGGGAVEGSARSSAAAASQPAGHKVAVGSARSSIGAAGLHAGAKTAVGSTAVRAGVTGSASGAKTAVGATVSASGPGARSGGAKTAVGQVTAAAGPVGSATAGVKSAAGQVFGSIAATPVAAGVKTAAGQVWSAAATAARTTPVKVVVGAARSVAAAVVRLAVVTAPPEAGYGAVSVERRYGTRRVERRYGGARLSRRLPR